MTRRLTYTCLFKILCIIFASSLFAATPQINTVVGTLQSGAVMTISGQYLMDEDKTNWLSPFKTGTSYGFEGASYTSDGYYFAPDEMVHGTRGYDTNVKLSGSKSIYGRVTAATKTGAGFGIDLPSGMTEIYTRFYSRWNSAGSWKWPDSYIKNHLPLGNFSDGQYTQPRYGSSSALPTEIDMTYDSQGHGYAVTNFLQNNRWYCFEIRNKTSSPTNFTVWVDGVLIASVSPAIGSQGTMERVLFGMINMCCQGPGFDLTNWIDNFTVSTSRVYPSSFIAIGNSSDYATATKVYQAPVYLSDTSVQITANLLGLGAGPYYLWVTNNRQERSAAYPLSGGIAPPDAAPSPPTGLRIISE